MQELTNPGYQFAGADEAQAHYHLMQRFQRRGARTPHLANDVGRRINLLVELYKVQLADAEKIDRLAEEEAFEVTVRTKNVTFTQTLAFGPGQEVINELQEDSMRRLNETVAKLEEARRLYAEYAQEGEFAPDGAYLATVDYQDLLLLPVNLVEPRMKVLARNPEMTAPTEAAMVAAALRNQPPPSSSLDEARERRETASTKKRRRRQRRKG